MAAWGARPARFCNKGETWAYHGADYPEAGCGAGWRPGLGLPRGSADLWTSSRVSASRTFFQHNAARPL
jgi:hypothetical protein